MMRKFLIIFAAVAGLTVAVDGFLIEPYRIEVTHSSVQAPVTRPLKIAHLSDLHTSGLGRRERKLLLLLEAEHPDVIVITGDTVTWGHHYDKIRQLLSRLNAPLGVWLVRGNWENNYTLQVRRARPATSRDEISQTRCLAWLPNYSNKSSSLAYELLRSRLGVRCAAAFFIGRKLRAS
jgi:predicted MPP superfamily phosphohydrolase